MPRETVQDTAGSYDVRVGWSPDTVQIGVEQAAGFSLVTMLYGDIEACEAIGQRICERLGHRPNLSSDATDDDKSAVMAQLGREVLNIVEGSQTVPGSASYTGVWSTQNRAGINRLITILRRARDAAFGRDE